MDELALQSATEAKIQDKEKTAGPKGYWGVLMHYFSRYDRLDSY